MGQRAVCCVYRRKRLLQRDIRRAAQRRALRGSAPRSLRLRRACALRRCCRAELACAGTWAAAPLAARNFCRRRPRRLPLLPGGAAGRRCAVPGSGVQTAARARTVSGRRSWRVHGADAACEHRLREPPAAVERTARAAQRRRAAELAAYLHGCATRGAAQEQRRREVRSRFVRAMRCTGVQSVQIALLRRRVLLRVRVQGARVARVRRVRAQFRSERGAAVPLSAEPLYPEHWGKWSTRRARIFHSHRALTHIRRTQMCAQLR